MAGQNTIVIWFKSKLNESIAIGIATPTRAAIFETTFNVQFLCRDRNFREIKQWQYK